MRQMKLRYTDPETAGAKVLTVDVLSPSGWYTPDQAEIFPGIQHRYLSGGRDEQIAGIARQILIDIGVITTAATQKGILYFHMDPDRKIDLVIDAPTGFTATPSAGGSLPATTHYYVVTALDEIGQTIASTEDSAINAAANLQNDLAWNAVSGASSYRIYRSTTTATYGASSFLIEVTTNSYTDTGAVALSQGQPPPLQQLPVALQNPAFFSNEWMDGNELAKKYTLQLMDAILYDKFVWK